MYVEIGGPQEVFPPYFFQVQKEQSAKFHVTCRFYSHEIESLFAFPPLTMAMNPPHTLSFFNPPFRKGIGTCLNKRACRLPRGMLQRWLIFLSCAHSHKTS
jgi:hypothetical protein